MSLFLCQSFITNLNITPAREIPPATSREAGCPILSSFNQNWAAAQERDPGEVCWALQEHPGTGWVIQTHSGFVGGGK